MLTSSSQRLGAIQAKMRRRLRRYWDEPALPSPLGCSICPERGLCGGLHMKMRQFDCLGHCCNEPEKCSKVCRNKARDFVERVREVRGFDLANTPRAPELSSPQLAAYVPLLYHRGGREAPLQRPVVALPLYALFAKATGAPRFSSRNELCAAYSLAEETVIVLSGTAVDPPLERWWRYGEAGRAAAIEHLRRLNVGLVTAPNYSLFANVPRWDDLHSMKRIAIVHGEFLRGGVPAALHVNGRTERDFARWAEFVDRRAEITHLAYEFGTGAGYSERMARHVAWLCDVAKRVRRPLTLVVRGGLEILPELSAAFDSVVFIDTAAFMKTVKRQKAVRVGNADLAWRSSPTARSAALDKLFDGNATEMARLVEMLTTQQALPMELLPA